MFISNINSNKYYTCNPTFGTTNKFRTIKKFQLQPSDFEKVVQISDSFNKVSEFFASLNGMLQKKFKTLYPGIVPGKKMKGFLFDSILNEKNKILQITRFNTQNNSNELLSFGLLDSDNKNILRYKIDKDKNVFVMKEKTNSDTVDPDSLYKWNLDSFAEEMNYLELYAQNFKEVGRKTNGTENKSEMHELLNRINLVKKSHGMQDEICELSEIYKDLLTELNKTRGRDSLKLKEEYFKKFTCPRSKSMFFKDPQKPLFYSYTNASSITDNRACKLMICDESGKPLDGFLCFKDGKISRINSNALNAAFVRGFKMEPISDETIQNLNLPNIINVIKKGLEEFKIFIIAKREEKSKNIRPYIKHTQTGENSANPDKLVKEKTNSVKRKTHTKNTKVVQIGAEQQSYKLHAAPSQKEVINKTVSQKHPDIPAENTSLEINQADGMAKKVSLSNINLSFIIENLNTLFDTPVEQRSPHLIHERLSDGRIFSGRISMKTSDGAELTVSKMKSPRYVDFVYYSVKISDNNTHYTINLDPEMGMILESTPEGKVIIDKRQRVQHISKKDFLEQTPEAEKLADYLNELFEHRTEGEKKIVKSKLKMRGITEKEREKEVLKAIGQAPDIPLDSFYKL